MEKKIWEYVQCILVYQLWLCPDFVVQFFILISFSTMPLLLLVKCEMWNVTNSGGLIMLVCRWASVNDLVQNKLSSIIHLLSQHLLDQSHWRKHQMNVQDLLKVNNKDIRTKSLTSFWFPYSKHISHYALAFLLFLLFTLNR